MYIPDVEIKPYQSKYRDKVKQIVMNLQKFYPDIERWWDEKEIHKIESNQDHCLMVLDGRDSVVGIAVSGHEKEGTAKLKTFYLSKEFEGYSIEPMPALAKLPETEEPEVPIEVAVPVRKKKPVGVAVVEAGDDNVEEL